MEFTMVSHTIDVNKLYNALIMCQQEIERLLDVIDEMDLFKEPTENDVLSELTEIIEELEENVPEVYNNNQRMK